MLGKGSRAVLYLKFGEALGLLIDPLGDGEHRLDYRVESDGSVTISTAAALDQAAGNTKK